jgi:hypothetical protein
LLLAVARKEKSQKLFMMLIIKEEISKVDSTQVPFLICLFMEGTDYLIHPVGDLRVYERGKSKIWFFQCN